MIEISPEQIQRLAPNARSSYRAAFAAGQPVLDKGEISASPRRVAHFMAQVLHETGGLTILVENLNYSAKRLPQVWPSRFQPRGPLDPTLYAHNAEKLANEVYGGRMGNSAPGDGYRYRGRGLLQLTGREAYRQMTTALRRYQPTAPDFEADPEQVLNPAWSLPVAVGTWVWKGCNPMADLDSVEKVTRKINGGQIGIADRKEWLRRCKAVWPS